MKEIIERLAGLRVDLYQHVAVSAAITALAVVLWQIAFHNKTLTFVASLAVLLTATWAKEYKIDGKPDVVDAAFNLIGGAIVWVVFFIG